MKEAFIEIVELEQRLLSAWLTRPILRAAWTPDPVDLLLPKSQALALACRAVESVKQDDLTMKAMQALEAAGKLSLWAIGDEFIRPAGIESPLALLKRWREARALKALRDGLEKAMRAESVADARVLANEAIHAASARGDAIVYTQRELLERAYNALVSPEARAASVLARSGTVVLDDMVGGLRAGHVWVLGAPTNWGKSWWLMALIARVVSVGIPALYVTCEDDPEMLGQRLLSLITRVPNAGTARQLSAEEHLAAADALANAANWPFMLDGRGRDADTLATDIRLYARLHGVRVVVVDYLQCIAPGRKCDDRRGEINHVARSLTDAIKTSGCAGVLGSQLTGEDIRESRDVEHAAEVVLIGRESKGAYSLFLKKNKTGPKDAVIDLAWDKRVGGFKDD